MKKRKSKKKWVFLCVLLIALGAVGYSIYLGYNKKEITVQAAVKAIPLIKGSLTESISVSGSIYSANTKNVSSEQKYLIKDVYVKAGDKVKAGDVLAVMDMKDLEYEIKQAENNIASAEASAAEEQKTLSNSVTNSTVSVESSKVSLEKQYMNYETLKSEYENNTSSQITSAQNAIDSAQNTVDSAQNTINSAQKDVDSAQKDVDSAKRDMETSKNNIAIAENDMQTKKTAYESNEILYNAGVITKSELTNHKNTLQSAIDAIESAKVNYDKAVASHDKALMNLEKAVASHDKAVADYDKAVASYDKAVENLNITKNALAQSLKTAEKDLQSAELAYKNSQNSLSQAEAKTTSSMSIENQKIALEKLYAQLDDREVIAPIDGTITESNAVVGSEPTGVLFVIEDTEDLYVSTTIKEYNLAKVSLGQKTMITSDATESETFDGEIVYISPKAVSEGGSTSVEFESHAKIINPSPLLKIGMNAYVDIILNSKTDVYSVFYDMVVTNREGQSVIYTLENNVVVEVPVTTGLETSASVEISGDGLKDGMMIIANPSDFSAGQVLDAPGSGSDGQRPMRIFNSQGGSPEGGEGGRPQRIEIQEGGPGPGGGAMPGGRTRTIITQ